MRFTNVQKFIQQNVIHGSSCDATVLRLTDHIIVVSNFHLSGQQRLMNVSEFGSTIQCGVDIIFAGTACRFVYNAKYDTPSRKLNKATRRALFALCVSCESAVKECITCICRFESTKMIPQFDCFENLGKITIRVYVHEAHVLDLMYLQFQIPSLIDLTFQNGVLTLYLRNAKRVREDATQETQKRGRHYT